MEVQVQGLQLLFSRECCGRGSEEVQRRWCQGGAWCRWCRCRCRGVGAEVLSGCRGSVFSIWCRDGAKEVQEVQSAECSRVQGAEWCRGGAGAEVVVQICAEECEWVQRFSVQCSGLSSAELQRW